MQEDKQKLLHFGTRLRKIRKNKRLTLEAICYKNGLEPSTLSRIEKGIVDPKYLTLLKVAQALNMKLRDFFEE